MPPRKSGAGKPKFGYNRDWIVQPIDGGDELDEYADNQMKLALASTPNQTPPNENDSQPPSSTCPSFSRIFSALRQCCCTPEEEPDIEQGPPSSTPSTPPSTTPDPYYQSCTNGSRKFNHTATNVAFAMNMMNYVITPLVTNTDSDLFFGLILITSGFAKMGANLANLIIRRNHSEQTILGILLGFIEASLGLLIAGFSPTDLNALNNALKGVAALILNGELTFYTYHTVTNSSTADNSPQPSMK